MYVCIGATPQPAANNTPRRDITMRSRNKKQGGSKRLPGEVARRCFECLATLIHTWYQIFGVCIMRLKLRSASLSILSVYAQPFDCKRSHLQESIAGRSCAVASYQRLHSIRFDSQGNRSTRSSTPFSLGECLGHLPPTNGAPAVALPRPISPPLL